MLLAKEKLILDACCGGRMFWFDKTHKNVLFVDKRIAENGHEPLRPNHCVKPDVQADFRCLPFSNGQFKLVVFDPPHILRDTTTGILVRRFGALSPKTWKEDLKAGFTECWRVLELNGVLIFKWAEVDVPLKEVLSLIPVQPLFGHKSGRAAKTHWLCFMKLEESNASSR